MSNEGQLALEPGFPDPAQQAEVLLEVCEGDVREAQIIAGTNLKFASDETERLYWYSVEALLSKEGASARLRKAVE